MRLAVIASASFAPLTRLGTEASDVETVAGTTADALRGRLSGVDAVVISPRLGSVLVDLWREMGTVRWIHALGAGVETLPFDLLKTSDAVVTNSRGIYSDGLAEFAIASMFWFAKDLRKLVRDQEAHRWEPFTVQRVEGSTVGIIGYGATGQAVGRRAAALGMNVLGVRRRQEFGDPTVEDVLQESDYVVLSTPLTPSTRRMINRERLALMKPNAVLVNLARGALVDEGALVDVLASGGIRGAALDVFETEPLPAESPLWDLQNVLLSPHTADRTHDSHDRAVTFFLENLARFQRGEPLENVVDKDETY